MKKGLLALLCAGFPATGSADVLRASLPDGRVIAQMPVPDGGGWCVVWRHSVKLFEVQDCYVNIGGEMVLQRSHLPDFAAGLDHIPGRGRQVSDGQGGYWIEDISEPVPGNSYVLRPGRAPVNHRLRNDAFEISLSDLAAGARVTLTLQAE